MASTYLTDFSAGLASAHSAAIGTETSARSWSGTRPVSRPSGGLQAEQQIVTQRPLLPLPSATPAQTNGAPGWPTWLNLGPRLTPRVGLRLTPVSAETRRGSGRP